MIALISENARTSDDKEFMLALYNEYQRLMYYTARKYCSDINDCEEVVQEVVLKLINKIPLLRTLEEKALAGYVSVAVRNTAITWLRKQAREHKMFVNWPEEASEIPDTDLGIEESLILKEKKASMLEIWDLMSEEDRFLLEGRYILQYSDNELAEMIGCKASSLRMKMSRVRRKALKLMTERDRGDGSK